MMSMRKMDQWEASWVDCGSYKLGPKRHERFAYASEIYQASVDPISFGGAGNPTAWRLEVTFGTLTISGMTLAWSPYATARDAMEACAPCIKAYAEKLIRTSPAEGSSALGLSAAADASKRRDRVSELEAEIRLVRGW